MCTQKGMMLFLDGILQVVVIQYYINTIKLVQNKWENWNSCWKFTEKCVNIQLGKWIDYVSTKEFVFNHAIHNLEIIIGKSFHGTNF